MKQYIISFSLLTPFFLPANYLTIIALFYLTNNLEGSLIYSTLVSNIIQIIISIWVVSQKSIVVTFVDNE
ncbi:hypothetical protein KII91_00730 [Leuconostoc gelidum subsp. gelidum]|uniref:hypothetical protein n=1 Tax=Leuconostoc gelidum TaxID=1244 RepID=UPI001CC6D51F|nr:hypothetical protein [Leuconostoc gelidum]MBZ5977866.1 hypothetical protein [Leuconostoc gelidum subsp. gelidum]MBZ6001236.1 hypothetical protein [Leuconostoc gelidum subsp. gelidum]